MDDTDEFKPSSRSQRGLDWLNFFIADVQTGFGPFVAVYLAAQHWPQGEIGLLLTVGGLTGVASQFPGGALVDALHSKRLLIGAAVALIGVGALIFAFFPATPMVFLAEVLHGCTAGVIRPALAAIALGLVGHAALSGRLGRNHRYDSLGNAATAGVMGLLGHFVAKQATFLFAAVLCIPAIWSLLRIRGREIDYATARSARDRQKPREVARLREMARSHALWIFIAGLVLFQFANASVTPLASERLGQRHGGESELVTSALVVVPQLVSALIAGWVARRAEDWGRKPLLLAGFAVLPVRALLFAWAPGPWYLVAFQGLGGLTAAMIGIMTPLVIADLARGSGRYNATLGVAGTATGIGAAVSTTASGYAAELFGYGPSFLVLGAVGLVGLALFYGWLPETRPAKRA
ncbi:MAG TPA: MFS transporter [Stellaceae bacterium]|nr:MFS transporter [Stellaceae bacterium]